MNKILMILVVFVAASGLWGETKETPKIKNVGISSGLLTGINIGIGKTYFNSDGKIRERITGFKIEKFTPDLINPKGTIIPSLYFQRNYFFNSIKEGWFGVTKWGIQIIPNFSLASDPGGGSSGGGIIFPLPNLSAGYGYCFPVSKNTSLRAALDVGIQVNIINFNLSYIF